MRKVGSAGVLALLLAGAALAAPAANAPVHWPSVHSRVPRDPAIEARIDRILKRMSVEEKVGQVDPGRYFLGHSGGRAQVQARLDPRRRKQRARRR